MPSFRLFISLILLRKFSIWLTLDLLNELNLTFKESARLTKEFTTNKKRRNFGQKVCSKSKKIKTLASRKKQLFVMGEG